jgi:phosphoenolpyruvate synthase/pyruvate phosphate dikinase
MCVLLSPCLPSTKSYFTDVEPYLKPLNTLKAQNVKQIPRSCTDYKKVKVHRYDKANSISHDEVKYGKKKDFMQMQVRAVVIAAMNVIKDGKKRLGRLEFLVPLRSGLEFEGPDSEEGGMITLIQDTAQHVFDMFGGMCVPYCIGVMVQTPRACLLMDRLARNCSVSTVMFDCDSLTELMFGSSIRGEGAKKRCYEEGFDWKIVAPGNFYSGSAFDRLDKDGVGSLLRQAVRLFR